MDDFHIDARRWRFLDNPARYIEHGLERGSGGLQLAPLTRQFRTAKAILECFNSGRGVLLADDVGLGKTTVGVLVAWAIACQDKRVRIYAPNEVLRRHWAEELERHIPLLQRLGGSYAAVSSKNIRQEKNVERLRAGSIQIATHHALVKSHDNNEQRTACDLMIIDEAHRAKGDGSAFNEALRNLGDRAQRKLILTATPFSIRLAELEQLLQFVGAIEFEAVRRYADELERLYGLGDGYDVTAESERLVGAAKAAIEELKPYCIRHSIDDLSARERKHFGEIEQERWEIPTAPATPEDLALLLRMDRLLQLVPERQGERRIDPRFYVGWQYFERELERAAERATSNPVARRHIDAARKALRERRTRPHPKIAAVSDAIRSCLDNDEKVLVFCHHRATASELLNELEKTLKTTSSASYNAPPEDVWRAAWESLLFDGDDPLVGPLIDWLCTPGLRLQIGGWIGAPTGTVKGLAHQLKTIRPRHATRTRVPTIFELARALKEALLDPQSTSTRALLKNMARGSNTFGGQVSHFPGRLDDGLRVMGAWDHGGHGDPPKTLYSGAPDIVLALFNSPFGPDVLVTTDHLSEGVDLHRCCRHVIQYELDASPIRTLQRNGRVRRVGSWASLTGQPIRYAYPTFGGTRDEKAADVMCQRIGAFGLLLGGVPSLDRDVGDSQQRFANKVMEDAKSKLENLNKNLLCSK
jgi:ERCC4-related helicase